MFYLTLLDAFRNCPLVVSFNDKTKNTDYQVAPKELFTFIENELKDCVNKLARKESLGTQALVQANGLRLGLLRCLCVCI